RYGAGYVSIPQMARAGIWLNLIGIVLISMATLTLAVWVFDLTYWPLTPAPPPCSSWPRRASSTSAAAAAITASTTATVAPQPQASYTSPTRHPSTLEPA